MIIPDGARRPRSVTRFPVGARPMAAAGCRVEPVLYSVIASVWVDAAIALVVPRSVNQRCRRREREVVRLLPVFSRSCTRDDTGRVILPMAAVVPL